MPLVLEKLHEKEGLQNVQLILTDLYPNPEAIKRFNKGNADKIQYRETSVDATNFVSVPDGLKTMVNSFHHMSPEKARKILRSAEENNQPFLIHEMAENKTPLLVWWVLLPIGLIILMVMTLFMTPFVKPLTWQQVVFTYLVPIIPICYAWDGQASLPRMYSMKDMDLLLEGLGSQDYVWTKGPAMKRNGKKLGTYVMGLPSR